VTDFAGLKLGKLSPRCPVDLKDMAVYAPALLAPPPARVDYFDKVPSYPMALNDRFGDCVVAGAVHARQTWAAEVNLEEAVPADAVIQSTYFGLTGGQDTGLVEASFLETWRTKGMFGGKIDGYAPVHPQHADAVKNCIDLFGCAFVGVQLPQSAEQQFGAGQPWTVVDSSPLIGGHCVILAGYDANWLYAITWGLVQRATWSWWQTYGDECWAILSSEFQEAGKGPVLNLAALKADLPALKDA